MFQKRTNLPLASLDRIKMLPEHTNCTFFTLRLRTLKNHLKGVEMNVFLINRASVFFCHITHHNKVKTPGRVKLSIETDLCSEIFYCHHKCFDQIKKIVKLAPAFLIKTMKRMIRRRIIRKTESRNQ
jgi:hypothetical protein